MIKILLTTLIVSISLMAQSQYCMTGGPSSANDSQLQGLQFTGTSGGINYIGCPGVLGVEEYLVETTTVNAGSAYVMTIQFGTCGGNFGSVATVWIDFNANNLFEPSEEVITWQGSPPMAPANYVVSIPAGALSGQTKMRVMQAESQSLPLDPCIGFTWGSVTDFIIEIENGIDCSSYIGDDSSDPRIVTSIPYSESYDNSFCYSNQNPAYNSPDVYYLITPGTLTSINASLCGSSFDTYLSVQDKWGITLALNDDYASCGTSSEINFATAGHDSLYIVVEGWGTEMGAYTLTINEGVLGTTELANDPFAIFPNPAHTSFQLGGNYSGNVSILNTEGKVVLDHSIEINQNIEISTLSPGFYIVRLQSDTQVYDKKLIIE
ncbi:MAG: hypothetical protein ACJA1C_003101 [Crocinitomicaceae bacterium]|jgi:hypothetical protein